MADGALGSVGSEGSLWVGAASGSLGVELLFNASKLVVDYPTSRAYGLPVRCLQAFIGILFLSFKSIL